MPAARTCVLLVTALFIALFAARNTLGYEESIKPDILLIMPDQMRGDCLSALAHPVVRTPTIDRLAQQGTLFRRAYSTVPSCIPARYAMLTGLSPQTSGVVGFRKKAITRPTMPQLLRGSGYATVLVGREMHQQVDDKELGYQVCVSGSTYVSDDQYALEVEQAFPEIGEFRPWVEKLGLTYNHWQAQPWPLPTRWHPTAWVARQARQIVSAASLDQPLFLTASFYAPHPPLFPPKDLFNSYLQKKLPKPAHGDWVAWQTLTTRGAQGGHRVLLEGEALRRAQAGYFGLIEQLDQELAPLVAEFKARSERAGHPWLIVVTSDHGEMLGDHGFFRKCEPFEGSANVPMVIAGSSELGFTAGQRSLQPVCLEDLLPTFAQLAFSQRAGFKPADVDGVSLLPVLRGDPATLRSWLHFEHATCYSKQQAFHALTDGHSKYIWRPHDGRELLFDLDQDSREEHDLAADPTRADLLAKWRQLLIQRLAPRPEGFSDGKRLISGRPYPPLNAGVTR